MNNRFFFGLVNSPILFKLFNLLTTKETIIHQTKNKKHNYSAVNAIYKNTKNKIWQNGKKNDMPKQQNKMYTQEKSVGRKMVRFQTPEIK